MTRKLFISWIRIYFDLCHRHISVADLDNGLFFLHGSYDAHVQSPAAFEKILDMIFSNDARRKKEARQIVMASIEKAEADGRLMQYKYTFSPMEEEDTFTSLDNLLRANGLQALNSDDKWSAYSCDATHIQRAVENAGISLKVMY